MPVNMKSRESRDITANVVNRMPVRVGDKLSLLPLRDILWIQSKGDLICLHSQVSDYDCRMTMTEVQTKLDPSDFLRVHRNAIVNLSHVVEFSLPRGGNAFVYLNNGKSLPISRTGRFELRRYLASYSRVQSNPRAKVVKEATRAR
jgi:two-component system, LytTR family, response regulator